MGALPSPVHFHLPLPPLGTQIPEGPGPGLLAPVLAVPHVLLWPSSGQAPDSHSDWPWPAANRPGSSLRPFGITTKRGSTRLTAEEASRRWGTSVTRRMIAMTTEHLEVLSMASGAPRITSKPSATPRAGSVTHPCEGDKSETGWWAQGCPRPPKAAQGHPRPPKAAQGRPRPPKAAEATRDSNPDRAECKATLSLAPSLLVH